MVAAPSASKEGDLRRTARPLASDLPHLVVEAVLERVPLPSRIGRSPHRSDRRPRTAMLDGVGAEQCPKRTRPPCHELGHSMTVRRRHVATRQRAGVPLAIEDISSAKPSPPTEATRQLSISDAQKNDP